MEEQRRETQEDIKKILTGIYSSGIDAVLKKGIDKERFIEFMFIPLSQMFEQKENVLSEKSDLSYRIQFFEKTFSDYNNLNEKNSDEKTKESENASTNYDTSANKTRKERLEELKNKLTETYSSGLDRLLNGETTKENLIEIMLAPAMAEFQQKEAAQKECKDLTFRVKLFERAIMDYFGFYRKKYSDEELRDSKDVPSVIWKNAK